MTDKKETISSEGKEQNKKITPSYDAFFKSGMKDPMIRNEFLQNHLPQKFLKLFSQTETKLYPNTFVDKKMRKYESDLVLFNEQKNTMLYIVMEHQSSVDQRMAFRVQQYVMRVLEDFVHQNKNNGKKLPFVFPMVVYAGKEKYTAAKMLWEISEYPEIQKEIWEKGYHLVDLQAMGEEEFVEKKQQIFEFFLKTLIDKDPERALEFFFKTMYNEGNKIAGIALDLFYRFVLEYFPEEKHQEILKLSEKVKKGIEIMRTGAQALREEGMQQGRKEGIRQEQQQIAKNMLSLGANIEFISKSTGLSQEQIKQLQD